jgi:diguanylate cyclase (GGDEF)-like protein
VAEVLRGMVAEHPFPGRETQPLGKVTVSIGVAGFPEDGGNAAALLTCADQLLYRAKNSGKNQVAAMPSSPS